MPDQRAEQTPAEVGAWGLELACSMALLDAHADLLALAAPPYAKDVPYTNMLRIDANVRHAIARVVLDVVRSLPVNERMEAMGMTVVGRWRCDVTDQCRHCEPERLYQTWSREQGFSYDAETEDDQPVYVDAEHLACAGASGTGDIGSTTDPASGGPGPASPGVSP